MSGINRSNTPMTDITTSELPPHLQRLADITPPLLKMRPARELLGSPARSTVYELIAAGKLEAVRSSDAPQAPLLITTLSILRHIASLPQADVKPRKRKPAVAPSHRGRQRKARAAFTEAAARGR